MKYIIIAAGELGDLPIVFPDVLTHSIFARGAVRAIETEFRSTEIKPVAAGFVNSRGEAWGESESMKLKARPEVDTRLLQRLLRV